MSAGEAGRPPVDRDGPAPSPIPHVVSTTQGLRVGRPLPAQRRPRTRSHSRHHRHPLPLHDPLNSKHGQRWLGRRDPFDSGAPASLSCGLIEQLFPRHDQRSLSGIASLLVGYAVPAGRLGRVALLTSSRSYRPPVRVALYGRRVWLETTLERNRALRAPRVQRRHAPPVADGFSVRAARSAAGSRQGLRN